MQHSHDPVQLLLCAGNGREARVHAEDRAHSSPSPEHQNALGAARLPKHVPHRDYISFPPRGAFVVVYDDSEHVFVLPLLAMTGLAYQAESPDAKTPPAS